jgi:hypothetical protein
LGLFAPFGAHRGVEVTWGQTQQAPGLRLGLFARCGLFAPSGLIGG